MQATCHRSVIYLLFYADTEFFGALCHCIKTCLGEEHIKHLSNVDSCNAFIREPILTKEMWDGVLSAADSLRIPRRPAAAS